MKMFDDVFHSVLHCPFPRHDVVLADEQLGCSGAHPAQATALLLQYQHAVMQQMKQAQPDVTEPDVCSNSSVAHPAPFTNA